MGHFREITVFFVVFCAVWASPAPKTSEDFEFVEERSPTPASSGGSTGTRTWLLDPANALCGLLRCGSREVCLLQDRFTAVCVDKAEVARSGDKVVPLEKNPSSELPMGDDPNVRFPGQQSSKRIYSSYDSADNYKFRDADDDFDNDDDLDDDDDDDYYDDEDDYDDDDEEEREESDGKYTFNDEDDDDAHHDDDDRHKNLKENEENVTEDSSLTTSSSVSPQLDRQPFASKQCGGCPLIRPVFLCGSDNRTYSSTCRLHFHNCIHQAKVEVACKGFCPCKEPGRRSSRRNKTSLMGKLRATQQRKQQLLQQQPKTNDNKHASSTSSNRDVSTHRPNKTGNKKYKKYNKNVMRKKGRYANKRRNEVLHTPTNNVWGPNECSQDALAAMGNRMLDWFSVIMSDAQHKSQPSTRAPSWCKHEVAWMLGHLDSDSSGQLEGRELYQLEHDDRERCIKPFFDRCDLDRDGHMSGREWCKCFDKSERPCAALRTASQGLLGGYIPECDSEGWYRPVQCQGSGTLCWCVDRHGVELPYSRTHGRPRCDTASQTRDMSSNSRTSHHDDDDDDDSDETIIEGSADMPLDI